MHIIKISNNNFRFLLRFNLTMITPTIEMIAELDNLKLEEKIDYLSEEDYEFYSEDFLSDSDDDSCPYTPFKLQPAKGRQVPPAPMKGLQVPPPPMEGLQVPPAPMEGHQVANSANTDCKRKLF